MQNLKPVFAFLLFFLSSQAFAAKAVPMTIVDGGQQFTGTLYIPGGAKGSLPLVVVVPEWWGKNAYVDHRADMVADQTGAAALAVDVYGGGKLADNPKEAMAMAGPFYQNPQLGVTRLNAFLKAAPEVAKKNGLELNLQKIVAIGYCFGGTQVLNLARSGEMPAGEKLVGVASFHGGLASTMKAKGPIKAKILVAHGAADSMVKPSDVTAFKSEMKADKAALTFVAYPGATHAFSNPEATALGKKFSMPIAYNEAADKGSWDEFKKFMSEVTK